MKKIDDFTKAERVMAVISAIWLVIWFVVAMNESRGSFDEGFISIFFIIGLLPVLIIVGLKWIKGAGSKDS